MEVKLSPAQRAALRYAESDIVLLVPKRGTHGSSDTRDDVKANTVSWLRKNGYVQLTISHGDDNADGYILTDKGREALNAS